MQIYLHILSSFSVRGKIIAWLVGFNNPKPSWLQGCIAREESNTVSNCTLRRSNYRKYLVSFSYLFVDVSGREKQKLTKKSAAQHRPINHSLSTTPADFWLLARHTSTSRALIIILPTGICSEFLEFSMPISRRYNEKSAYIAETSVSESHEWRSVFGLIIVCIANTWVRSILYSNHTSRGL